MEWHLLINHFAYVFTCSHAGNDFMALTDLLKKICLAFSSPVAFNNHLMHRSYPKRGGQHDAL
ncbi:hypothetical protein [Undibacterium sp. SXout20W]|uniref:hypothetical protein n=1 Tax=Undibacterium sp. SXout20W TaxID=3413051 RepID=UPI003BF3D907